MQKIPIRKYIEEHVNESLHECIRGNVLLATRYFNHRVKSFINNIVMGGGSPMMVDKFSYIIRLSFKTGAQLMCMESFG